MRKVLPILIAGLLVFAVLGCESNGNGNGEGEDTGYEPGQTAEAYAYIHGGYVGQVVASTNDDGELDVQIDEAFLPHTLAVVDIEEDEWNEDNTVTYESHGEYHAAKYVEYDGTVYVGTTVGNSVTYVEADEDGEPAGNKDLELEIIHGQNSMAAYFENIQDGAFKTFTEFEGDANEVTTTQHGSLTKRGSEYWNFGPLGWSGNIEAIEEFVEEEGVAYTLDEMEQAEEENDDELRPWSVADAVTGATLSDFPDYFTLVQTAVAKLN